MLSEEKLLVLMFQRFSLRQGTYAYVRIWKLSLRNQESMRECFIIIFKDNEIVCCRPHAAAANIYMVF